MSAVAAQSAAAAAVGAEDARWADAAASGDLTAFERLYRRHCGRVHALCLRLTADGDRAEELTQEAFVRAWSKLGSFGHRAAFGSWLYRLAVNVVMDDERRLRRRTDPPPPAEPTGSPAQRIDLERAVAGLPTKARQVFVLHDVEGYRHREIARIMGIRVGTSKGQLHRARRLLRQALTLTEGEPR